MAGKRQAIAFDMFGTLVDPASQAVPLASLVDDAQSLAAAWRRHQLEISWLLTLMERYEDWGQVTRYALRAALDEAGVSLGADQEDQLLARVAVPTVYEDVVDGLEALLNAGHELAVFSNGTPAQLSAIVRQTGLERYLGALVSVDGVGRYKPAPAVYQHAARELGRPLDELWLVSGNPFDAAGAKAAGMRVAKLERMRGFRYEFAPPPDLVVSSLRDLPAALDAWGP